MAKRPDNEASVSYFAPTNPHGESREQALDRVTHDEHLGDRSTPRDVDHTTARGVNRRVITRVLMFMAGGAVFGAVLGLILSFAPGPFETSTAGDVAGYMVVLAIAFAVVVGVVTGLLLLEREDGVTERYAEEDARKESANPRGGAGIG